MTKTISPIDAANAVTPHWMRTIADFEAPEILLSSGRGWMRCRKREEVEYHQGLYYRAREGTLTLARSELSEFLSPRWLDSIVSRRKSVSYDDL